MTTRRELDRLTDPDDAFTESEIGDMARDLAEDREQQRRERAALGQSNAWLRVKDALAVTP